MMTASEAWKKIVNGLSESPGDFKTVQKTNREALWFHASTDGNQIYVENAKTEKPSSRLTVSRKITFSDFETVYTYYSVWLSGKVGVRGEVREKSRNTAYIFGLISHFEAF